MATTPKHRQCWFKTCTNVAVVHIIFDRKIRKVCKDCANKSGGVYFVNGEARRDV